MRRERSHYGVHSGCRGDHEGQREVQDLEEAQNYESFCPRADTLREEVGVEDGFFRTSCVVAAVLMSFNLPAQLHYFVKTSAKDGVHLATDHFESLLRQLLVIFVVFQDFEPVDTLERFE